jgi:putative spermidine/putrescine transport system permease protein
MSSAGASSFNAINSPGGGPGDRLSTLLLRREYLLPMLLLIPPLLWFGVIYLGSLFTLLAQSFFRLDDFSGTIVYEVGLQNFVALLEPANLDVIKRSIIMATLVTIASVVIAFPLAYMMARYTRGSVKAMLYIAVMLPLWSSYLVRLYAWKLLLAKEGAIAWLVTQLHLEWLLEAILSTPVIGGNSMSFSPLGTFLVFVYMWLPFVILPIQASIERIPPSLIEASADLGAHPRRTFWTVILPLAMTGIAAGSIFSFSLTLGDYIIPQVIGNSTLFIGQVVYRQQGIAGNLPFAAAFSIAPIIIIAIYLWLAKRKGAFDAL